MHFKLRVSTLPFLTWLFLFCDVKSNVDNMPSSIWSSEVLKSSELPLLVLLYCCTGRLNQAETTLMMEVKISPPNIMRMMVMIDWLLENTFTSTLERLEIVYAKIEVKSKSKSSGQACEWAFSFEAFNVE